MVNSAVALQELPTSMTQADEPFTSKSTSLFPIEEIDVLFVCETGSGNEFLQKTNTERFSTVDRYRYVNITSFFYQDVMAPLYMIHLLTGSFKGGDMLIPACSRKSNHTLWHLSTY